MPTIESIKATFVRCSHVKHTFKDSRCALLVSVGSPWQEGSFLKSMLNIVNKNFLHCTILVCDSLQRYNFSRVGSEFPDDYHELSNQMGKKWIDENEKIISASLKIPYEIVRWDNWIKRSDFNEKINFVNSLYKKNSSLKNAIDYTITDFVEREVRKETQYEMDALKNNCYEYLVEEIAVIMIMMFEENYHYLLYPRDIIKALSVAHDILVKSRDPMLLNWVYVQLEKKSLYKVE